MTTEAIEHAPNGQLAARRQPTLKDLFESKPFQERARSVVPKHVDMNRLIRVALLAIQRTPGLLKCTQNSLLDSFMKAAQLGLDCGGPLGSAYLVPFGNEATLIIGYRGFIELARRSGQIASIQAQVVREGDEFEFEYGIEMKFRHKPVAPVTANVTHAWALAKFKEEGVYQLDVMSVAEVKAIQSRSRSGRSGPWITDFAEMAKKTVVRRLAKYLPLTPEMMDALEAEKNDFEAMETVATVPQDGEKPRRMAMRGRPKSESIETPTEDAAAVEAAQADDANDGNNDILAEEYSANVPPDELRNWLMSLPPKARTSAMEMGGVKTIMTGECSEDDLRRVAYNAKLAALNAGA